MYSEIVTVRERVDSGDDSDREEEQLRQHHPISSSFVFQGKEKSEDWFSDHHHQHMDGDRLFCAHLSICSDPVRDHGACNYVVVSTTLSLPERMWNSLRATICIYLGRSQDLEIRKEELGLQKGKADEKASDDPITRDERGWCEAKLNGDGGYESGWRRKEEEKVVVWKMRLSNSVEMIPALVLLIGVHRQ
ncbi:unnamed protein product [Allacma fusca]|uniref:Uncharacterized protein n=1 Tax=Allacma fusca TaxID=39272 RepID=A0A8J2KED2_9HEXA|nr:unnamed protein product [Allacma fusca]